MHYCENCGSQLDDDVYKCPYCGHQNRKPKEPIKESQAEEDHVHNGFAIAGFVLSLLTPIFGVIFSAIGFGVRKHYKKPYTNLAAAGLTIGIVFSLFGLFGLMAL